MAMPDSLSYGHSAMYTSLITILVWIVVGDFDTRCLVASHLWALFLQTSSSRTPLTLAAPSARGILAADESTGTIGKRFSSINFDTRRGEPSYPPRELLSCTPGARQYMYISGVILFQETLYQKTKDGKPFVDILKDGGVLLGIKLGTDKETTTQGHHDLGKRSHLISVTKRSHFTTVLQKSLHI
jgi:hypothetical protein